MTGGTVAAIIGLLAALALAWRGLRSHPMPISKRLVQALIWGAIILALVLVFSWLQQASGA